MNEFFLDERLAADCHVLHESESRFLLLLNNALYHWLVLVPKVEVTEWYALDDEMQSLLNEEVNQLSRWLKERMNADKINVASIGNVVAQMHIHVIGRCHDDAAWPGVVWGHPERSAYTDEAVDALRQELLRDLKLV